ncbi:hypothetical protein I4F81_006112 [Pyropia yezoensis]|uniref:Uncharacterized protein n=1 Tax=Pyropia yezoensis TaxID=2788 RepID=A0ACC3C0C7_PYRYE|nr:hypothetical protein I4F81_006112 [Neopyropia yezoensis]
MCCFADTHLPMPEADKPRGTTVPELNDKTLPPRHLGSHKADDEGDVTRPLPLAMLTYQHTRGATDASAGDDDASGGVLNGASGGMRGPGALPPPADEEDDEGDGAAAMEPPEPCLGLLDTCTDASVEAALTRAREMYGLDLLASLRSVTGYDRVRAVNWLRARVVREGGEGTAVAAAFERKVAEKGGWGGDAELLPVVAGDTLIAEVLGAEEEMEGEEGGGGG